MGGKSSWWRTTKAETNDPGLAPDLEVAPDPGLVPDPVPRVAPSRALNLPRLLLARAKSLDLLLLLGAARKKTVLDAAKTTTTKEASTVPVDRARRLGGQKGKGN